MVRRIWTVDGVEWISVRDAARALGVHENTVRHWMESGKLDYWQLPGDRTFRRVGLVSVQRVLAGQEQVSERLEFEVADLEARKLAEALKRAWHKRLPMMPPSAVNWLQLAQSVIDEMASFVTDVPDAEAGEPNVTGNVSAGEPPDRGRAGYNPEGWR